MPDPTEHSQMKASIQIRPIEKDTASAELQRLLKAVQDEVRRLEEAKIVTQETMKIEVSV
jgi:hypothetical protein